MTSQSQDNRLNLPLSLRTNVSWTFLGNMIYAATQWGVLIALAKFGTPELVGQYSLALAVTAPVILLTNMQLDNVQSTDAKRLYHFHDYFNLRFIMTALGLLMILGIVLVSGYRPEVALIVMAVGLTKAFEAISNIFYGLLQQRERMDRIAKSLILRGVLALAFFSVGLLLSKNILVAILGIALAWLLVLLFYDLRSGMLILGRAELFKALKPNRDFGKLARLTWLALPLGFVMMLISLNSALPRYFLESSHGEHTLGIFSALTYITVAGSTFVGALGGSATPRLAKYYAELDYVAFRRLVVKLIGIVLVIGVAGVLVAALFGQPLLTLIYESQYAEQVEIFVLAMLMAAVGYVSSIFGYSMTAIRFFRVQLILYALVTAATLVGCIALIPTYGATGAVLAMLAANIVQIILNAGVVFYVLYKRTPAPALA